MKIVMEMILLDFGLFVSFVLSILFDFKKILKNGNKSLFYKNQLKPMKTG